MYDFFTGFYVILSIFLCYINSVVSFTNILIVQCITGLNDVLLTRKVNNNFNIELSEAHI